MTEGWLSFRELDRRSGRPKGSAFRAFKQHAGGWLENRDYRVLDASRDRSEIEALRAAGRIYTATRNAVLLSPESAGIIAKSLSGNHGCPPSRA